MDEAPKARREDRRATTDSPEEGLAREEREESSDMLTRCVPCEQNRHGRCQNGQPTLGGDCGCWCVAVKAEAASHVQPTTTAASEGRPS